jgi:hypothetical protein
MDYRFGLGVHEATTSIASHNKPAFDKRNYLTPNTGLK